MKRWRAAMAVVAILASTLAVSQMTRDVRAGSTFFEDTDSDFSDGTFVNTAVVDAGGPANVRLSGTLGWAEVFPVGPLPPARRFHSLVFADSIAMPLLMFGQCAGEPCYLGDTWAYDTVMQAWVPRSNFGAGRAGVATAYEMGADRVVTLGGFDTFAGGDFYQDTCVYYVVSDAWSCLILPTYPAPRAFAQMAYHPGINSILMFGGNDATVAFGDTWIFDGANWIPQLPPNAPPARTGHAMVFDWVDDSFLMFGGNRTLMGGGALNDTWRFNVTLNDWVSVPTPVAPPARSGHAMTVDPVTGLIYLFGGRNDNGDPLDDTWVFDEATDAWYNVTIQSSPLPRYGHAMVSTVIGETFIFGGNSVLTPRLNDLWTLAPGTSQGSYYSGTIDSGGQTWTQWRTVTWNPPVQPAGTNLSFQFAANNDGLSWNYLGPDGTSGSEYTGLGSIGLNVSHFEGNRYFRYRAIFRTTATFLTPWLDNITVAYDSAPFDPTPLFPTSGGMVNASPVFTWSFTDPDGDSQEAFTVEVDDDPLFNSVDFGGFDVLSPSPSWDPGPIPDGVWYWRVRVRADSQWSAFASGGDFTLDTQPPTTTDDAPPGWAAASPVVVTLSPTDGGSGVCNTSYRIDGGAWSQGTSPSVAGDGIHTVDYYSEDCAGNAESPKSATVMIDTTGPTSAVAALPQYTGTRSIAVPYTAADATSGIDSVELWANPLGVGWSFYGTFNSSPMPYAAASDGIYEFYTRARDVAGNYEPPPGGNDTYTFVDTVPPATNITSPEEGDALRILSEVSGSASDDFSGVSTVEVAVRRVSTFEYWNGTAWTAAETWLTASGAEDWSLNTSTVDWVDDDYVIRARTTDSAGNVETPGTAVPVAIDTTLPLVTVTSPGDGEVVVKSSPYEIVWNVTDENVGLGAIDIHYSLDGGDTWTEIASGTNDTGSFLWLTPAIEADLVLVRVQATDKAGNVGIGVSGPFKLAASSGAPSFIGEYWWVVLLLLAVLLLIAALLSRRRAEPEPKKTAPPILGTTDTATVCGICLGAIKAGLTVVRCGECGKTFHDSCAGRVERCPSCETPINMDEAEVEGETADDEGSPPAE